MTIAGPAAVAGVLLCRAPAPAALLAGLTVVGWAAARRTAPSLVVGAALLAGLVAGAHSEARVARVMRAWRAGRPARAPPRPGTCVLQVEDCGEDPFHDRAWLEGRTAGGDGVRCAWPGRVPDVLAPGARVRVAGRFRVPGPPTNPGEPDRRRRLAERGIHRLADLRTDTNLVILRPAPPGPSRHLGRLRRAGARRLRRVLPDDVAPLAVALLLGVRTGVPVEDRLRFERTGTMHVLAISGMHLVLLAGFLHAGLRAAGAGVRVAAGITVVVAVAYVPVAGAGPPIRRAVTMLVLYGLALVRGRPADSASSLGGAALLIALADPADVFRTGFRLSFAAAAGIAWLAGPWHERWSARHRLLARFPAVRADRPVRLLAWGYVLRALPVSVAAWCATQGLVAHAFGAVTPVAPLTNVLVGPLVAILLPLTALLALGLDPLAEPVTWTARGLRFVLDGAADVPGGFLFLPGPPLAAVFSWCLGVAALRARPRFGLALLAVAGTSTAAAPPSREPALVLLDVGHGQAALARFDDGTVVLIDAGSRNRPAPGPRILLPALRALRIRRIAAVVCTHADADHWNALPLLLRIVPVGRLVVGPDPPPRVLAVARACGVPVERAPTGGCVHASEGARLDVVAADAPPGTENDRSVVLRFTARGGTVLLPADREEAGLRRLVAQGVGPCDVLVAPHHGAQCEVAADFGAATRPRWLLVSAARGFAHAPTLAAYGARDVLSTDRCGCIVVRLAQPGVLVVETYARRRLQPGPGPARSD